MIIRALQCETLHGVSKRGNVITCEFGVEIHVEILTFDERYIKAEAGVI